MRNVEHTITIEELELVLSSIIGLFPSLLLRRTARTNMERAKNFDYAKLTFNQAYRSS